ncbi:tyrosine-type recombinase/integrase [Glutamicibacter sp. 287]|uniref:tyrosine-type recombinase/integrase n=1 Tax=unclassified Glutamicibacter TaxID=2627139 RepID=UPI004033C5F1
MRTHEPWTAWVDQDGKERDLVFCRRGGLPMYPKADWLAWRSLLEDAQVPVGRPHDGRHTAATTMLLLGVPERVVMEILGWSQISMLTRYQHVLDEMHQDVAEKLTDHWAPKPPSAPSNVVSLADRLAARRAQNQ